jgi:exosortase/archaeosortase family protein
MANVIRVFGLIVSAYYVGADTTERVFHDMVAFLMFATAMVMFLAYDSSVRGVLSVIRRRPKQAVGDHQGEV